MHIVLPDVVTGCMTVDSTPMRSCLPSLLECRGGTVQCRGIRDSSELAYLFPLPFSSFVFALSPSLFTKYPLVPDKQETNTMGRNTRVMLWLPPAKAMAWTAKKPRLGG